MRRVFFIFYIAIMVSSPAHATMYIKAEEHITTYTTVAQLSYAKTHKTAVNLQKKINILLSNPTAETLKNAQKAWKKAHYYYSQTEAFNLPNTLRERLNQWPIDPNFIHEMHPPITKETITARHMEFEEVDITLGFHAIEYLLWGEDLNNGTASRLASDFKDKHKSKHLRITTDILVSDLQSIADKWHKDTGELNTAEVSQPFEYTQYGFFFG